MISVEVVGLPTLHRDLEGLKRIVSDLTPYGPRVAKWLRERVQQNISSEGRTGGSGFKSLSPRYEETKHRAGFGFAGILVRSGRMKSALTREGAQDSFQQFTPTEIVVGAVGKSGQVARYHQTGTRKMPARPPMQFTEADWKNLLPILRREIVPLIRKRSTFIQTEVGEVG